MEDNQFVMVSEWMTNGNINQFVTAHRNANRFELVSSPFKFLVPSILIDKYTTPAAGRCREGLDPHARPGNDPWGYQRGTPSRAWVSLFLMCFIYKG